MRSLAVSCVATTVFAVGAHEKGCLVRVRFVMAVLVVALGAGACSSGSDESLPASSEASSGATTQDAEPLDTAAETDDNVFARAAAAGASATLNLDNGETYAFNILCALESQESAGQEILFTAVSYDNPVSLVVTQFGAESLGGAATISLYDSETYDNVWSADTLIGGELALEMIGNTVTGSGVFLAGEERTGPGVPGSFEANC